MLSRVLLLRVLPTVAAMVLLCATALAVGEAAPGARGGAESLPDLDQEAPADLQVSAVGPATRPTYRLGFRSAVRNVGDGPLIVEGRRSDDTRTMVAEQHIERSGAPRTILPEVGRLRYVVSPDHRHWHLLGFERYLLRRAGSSEVVERDRKSGFCLGDRYRVTGRDLPAAPPNPVYTSNCGMAQPQFLRVTEGISVGYGDDYAANLEFQYLTLDGLRDGRYVLVHQVNGDRRVRERSYFNDAASALLALRWAAEGVPHVRVLRVCPDTDRCDGP